MACHSCVADITTAFVQMNRVDKVSPPVGKAALVDGSQLSPSMFFNKFIELLWEWAVGVEHSVSANSAQLAFVIRIWFSLLQLFSSAANLSLPQ